jgi:flap endonuclease-1
MGVDLGDLCAKRTITLESLSGRVIAIDAFNVLYQFLASIRQEDGTPLMDFKGRTTAHLSGLFYRTSKLIQNGIRPVYVFDGTPSALKEKTREARVEVKRKAEEKWKQALVEERFEDAKKYASATSRLTGPMIGESKALLSGMGIPWVQASGEGEAQAAMMVQNGQAYAVGSQDFDALLFGTPILVRNLSITGRRKVPRQDRYIMVEPEEIKLRETLDALQLTREKLIWIGILLGTDFNEGVPRVGPKTALKIIKEVDSLDSLRAHVKAKYDYEFEVEPERVMELFLRPNHVELAESPKWGAINESEVTRLLVDEHDFARERVEKMLSDIKISFREKGAQKKLGDWFQ